MPLVIRSMIAARKAKIIDLTFKRATAIDLAGRNILEAVQTSVYPRVIDCPPKNSKRPTLDAVAKNGIQLKVKARVTVRANLDQLIGGATEETIVARVGEGIVSAIGSAETHKQVLENPDRISKAVLARRLDSQTAFEIVSIDIADIDVGATSAPALQADQAEADTRVARARPKAAGRWPCRRSRKTSPRSKRTGRSWSRPRPRCRGPWPRRSAAAGWAFSITTNCRTCRPIRICGERSRRLSIPGGSEREGAGRGRQETRFWRPHCGRIEASETVGVPCPRIPHPESFLHHASPVAPPILADIFELLGPFVGLIMLVMWVIRQIVEANKHAGPPKGRPQPATLHTGQAPPPPQRACSPLEPGTRPIRCEARSRNSCGVPGVARKPAAGSCWATTSAGRHERNRSASR